MFSPCLSDNFLKGLKQNSHSSTKSDVWKSKGRKMENMKTVNFSREHHCIKKYTGKLLSLNVTAIFPEKHSRLSVKGGGGTPISAKGFFAQ